MLHRDLLHSIDARCSGNTVFVSYCCFFLCGIVIGGVWMGGGKVWWGDDRAWRWGIVAGLWRGDCGGGEGEEWMEMG